jgi:hypothetical protein
VANEDFWKAYDGLPDTIRRQADKSFALLKQDPKRPSLHFKKIGSSWSARVGKGYSRAGSRNRRRICVVLDRLTRRL